MKLFTFAAALMVAVSTCAFAQTDPAQSPATSTSTTQAAQASVPANGEWTPPDGQAIAPKTRAQVYQELVEAEKDGQLAYLNSTVYAHP